MRSQWTYRMHEDVRSEWTHTLHEDVMNEWTNRMHETVRGSEHTHYMRCNERVDKQNA